KLLSMPRCSRQPCFVSIDLAVPQFLIDGSDQFSSLCELISRSAEDRKKVRNRVRGHRKWLSQVSEIETPTRSRIGVSLRISGNRRDRVRREPSGSHDDG